MRKVGQSYGHVIYYDDDFYEQYIVLWPNKNHKELHRFDSKEEAENFIVEQLPKQWYAAL